MIVTGAADSVVRVWDMKQIEPLIVNQTSDRYLNFQEVYGADSHKHSITCLAFNSDDCCFATGSEDNSIKLYKYKYNGEMLEVKIFATIGGHKSKVHAIAFSPDGGRLVSSGDGPNLHVWWAAGPVHMTNLVGHTQGSKAVGFLPNQWVISGCKDGKTRLWDNQALDMLAEETQTLQTCMQTYNDDTSKHIINSFLYSPLPLAQKIKYIATK